MRYLLFLLIFLAQLDTIGQCDCPSNLDQRLEIKNLRICSNSIYESPKTNEKGQTLYFIERFKLYDLKKCTEILDMDKEIQTSFNFYINDSSIEIEENLLMPCLYVSDPEKPWADQTGSCAFNIFKYSLNPSSPKKIEKTTPEHDFTMDADSLQMIKKRVLQEIKRFDYAEKGLLDSLKILDGTGTTNPDLVYYGLLVGIMNNDLELIRLFENFETEIPEVMISKHEMIIQNMKYIREKYKNGG